MAFSGTALGAGYYLAGSQWFKQTAANQLFTPLYGDTLENSYALKPAVPNFADTFQLNNAAMTTTTVINVQLKLFSHDSVTLLGSYSQLTLTVYDRTVNPEDAVGSIDMLSTDKLTYLITTTGVHYYDYLFSFTMRSTGLETTIQIDWNVNYPAVV